MMNIEKPKGSPFLFLADWLPDWNHTDENDDDGIETLNSCEITDCAEREPCKKLYISIHSHNFNMNNPFILVQNAFYYKRCNAIM